MARKKQRHGKYINPTSIAVSAATVVALIVFFSGMWYVAQLRPASGDTASRLVHVEQSGTARLAHTLAKEGLIRSEGAFRMLAKSAMALENKVPKAGWYDLSPSMSAEEIWQRLCAGAVAKRKVTFPEGWTVEQMGERLDEQLKLPEKDFLAAAVGARVSRNVGFTLPKGRLEGYLFPTTYSLGVGGSGAEAVGEMLAAFNETFVKPQAKALKANKMTLHQIVTLASLVEREARVAAERPIIAGVLVNRLSTGMRLQCDATVQYAQGRHKTRLMYTDLKIDSPYNTYLHPGLPPGPICNPGLPSLLAALKPRQVPYLFYVAKPDGTHIFTSTYQEHMAAVGRLRAGK
jgi:UPF0755 protein